MKELICAFVLVCLPAAFAGVSISVFPSTLHSVAKQRGVTLEEAVDILKAEGVTGFDAAYSDQLLERYVAAGLRPANIFGWPNFLGSDNGEKDIDAFIAAAAKVGSPRVMVIPNGFTDGRASEAEFLKILSGYRLFVKKAAEKGIEVTIEDVGSEKNCCSYVKYLKRILDEVPDMGYALDSGNLYYAGRGENILDMMRYAGKRIKHIHLKDQTKENNRIYSSLGLGAVPNRTIIEWVRDNDYNGFLTLENPVGTDTLEDVVRQIAVLKFWLRDRK